jgi:hypothetical protein
MFIPCWHASNLLLDLLLGPSDPFANFSTLRSLWLLHPYPTHDVHAPSPPRLIVPVTLTSHTHNHSTISTYGFPPRAPGRQSRDSTRALTRGPSAPAAAHSVPCLVTNTPLSAVHPPRYSCLTKSEWPGAPSACGHVTLALAPHDSTAPRLMTSPPSRLMTSRPSRLMTPRPSRPHPGPGHSAFV